MASSPLLKFLVHARLMPVYVVGSHVYVKSLTSSGQQAASRLASLATEARLIPERCTGVSDRRTPLALRLRDFVHSADAIRFTVGELIPYLRLLGSEHEEDVQRDQELQYLVREFVALVAEVRRMFHSSSFSVLNGAELAGLLHAPCVISGELIIPLKSTAREVASGHAEFCFGGQRFMRDDSGAICLTEAVKSVEQAVYDRLFEFERDSREASVMASFASSIDRLLAFHRPVRGPAYDELYVDRFHRVQFRRGQSVLIRGPARKVRDAGYCYVGVPIHGGKRRELLTARPTETRTPTAFWRRDGRPLEGGVCMGDETQYKWLYSDRLSDAEAVVQWLDAATWIATERAILHGIWRRRRLLTRRRQLRDSPARTV